VGGVAAGVRKLNPPPRSVKYEDVYIKDYQTVDDAVKNLNRYFEFYIRERPHQSLGYKL
jgi:putative transposase